MGIVKVLYLVVLTPDTIVIKILKVPTMSMFLTFKALQLGL